MSAPLAFCRASSASIRHLSSCANNHVIASARMLHLGALRPLLPQNLEHSVSSVNSYHTLASTPAAKRLTAEENMLPVGRPRFLCVATAGRPFEGAIAEGKPSSFLLMESRLQERFVCMMMREGKKQLARRLLWDAMTRIRDTGQDPQLVFLGAIENARPLMEMRSMRSGQVPFPINPKRAEGQAMKWIIQAARKRKSFGGMAVGLSEELLQAFEGKGAAVNRRESVHKMAVANQAAAHFRWRSSSSQGGEEVDVDQQTYRPVGRRSIPRLQ